MGFNEKEACVIRGQVSHMKLPRMVFARDRKQSGDYGKTWKTAFDGLYKKKKEARRARNLGST